MQYNGKTGIRKMKSKKLLLFVIYIVFFFLPFTLSAKDSMAEKAYEEGDYSEAISLMEKSLREQGASSSLYYNLGNAYSQSGSPAGAVLNYEKALKLDPGNSQARNNLYYTESLVQIANEALTDGKNIDPTPADQSFLDWLRKGIARLSSNKWSVVEVIMFLLFLSGCASYIFISSVTIKKVGFFGGGVCLLLTCLACWFASISKSVAKDDSMCVLMADEVSLRLEPSDEAKEVASPLSSGTKLKILESAQDSIGGEWFRLYLNMEYTGWAKATEFSRITLN